MENKRICFICPWMSSDGGLQRVVSNIANQLANESNYEISLCIISMNNETYYPLNSNIKVDHLPNASKRKISLLKRVIGKIINKFNLSVINDNIKKNVYFSKNRINILEEYLIKEQFDCVIAACGELSLLLSCVNRNKIKSKLIGWQHNSYDAYFKKRGQYYFGLESLASKLYTNLDQIVVLTEHDKESYKNNINIDCKTIYNPLSFESDKKTNMNNKSLIFVGRLVYNQKGLDYLVEILKEIFSNEKSKDWNIVIVGDGDDKEKLIEEINKNNIADKVKMVGKSDNVLKYYLNSSILLNTSRWEGFGLVITEAMECGLPVIAFSTDGPNEIIMHNQNGYIVPKYDVKKFAEYVLELMENDKKRNEMSKKSIERAKKFETEKIIEEWKKIIK